MSHYCIHVGVGLSELIILISMENVPTVYPNKYSLDYLPTQFRYRYNVYRCRGVYWYKSNVNISWITKKAFDLQVFLCVISSAEFCSPGLVDTWRFSKNTRSIDRQFTWKNRSGSFTLTHNPTKFHGHWRCETGDVLFSEYNVITW